MSLCFGGVASGQETELSVLQEIRTQTELLNTELTAFKEQEAFNDRQRYYEDIKLVALVLFFLCSMMVIVRWRG